MSTRNDSITPLPARAGVHGTDGHGGRLPHRILMTADTLETSER